MLDCSTLGAAVEVDGVDGAGAAPDDGAAPSSNTGHSALSDPVAGGASLAGSGDGAGEETFEGEGAGEATFGFSLIRPPGECKQDSNHAQTEYVYPSGQ